MTRIPVRFHLYWAGSDRDGAVVGFFWAVVETLPLPAQGSTALPQLPGPKASDYHFTTRTDSTFIFEASQEVSERQHAFFIYAVDDKGRPDPTPARFIFTSYDRFPPRPVIDEFSASGTVYLPGAGGVVAPQNRVYTVSDTFNLLNTIPRDTVPRNAVLTVKWHALPTIPGNVAIGYRYKLGPDETTFNEADSSVHGVTYNTGIGRDVINAGQKVFTLQAVGLSTWHGETTRYFQMNFAPDSWFAGPDQLDPTQGWSFFTDGTRRYYYKPWPSSATIAGTMLSSDSADVLPALRTPRKSFFEIYRDRIFAHVEGDTVNANSWVVMPGGGSDLDSPYSVNVNHDVLVRDYPALQNSVVLNATGPNGSPVGLHSRIQVRPGSDPLASPVSPTESTIYPVIDPALITNLPIINSYTAMTISGKAYAVIRAEDGDLTKDSRLDQQASGAIGVADRVDGAPGAGSPSPEDLQLRTQVLTFYVNRKPHLHVDLTLRPQTNQPLATRSPAFTLNFDDADPYDATNPGSAGVGGPDPQHANGAHFAYIQYFGKNSLGQPDSSDISPQQSANGTTTVSVPAGAWVVPPNIVAGPLRIRITLCDCIRCEYVRGVLNDHDGRCSITDLNYTFTATGPADLNDGSSSTLRPGSTSDASGRNP